MIGGLTIRADERVGLGPEIVSSKKSSQPQSQSESQSQSQSMSQAPNLVENVLTQEDTRYIVEIHHLEAFLKERYPKCADFRIKVRVPLLLAKALGSGAIPHGAQCWL